MIKEEKTSSTVKKTTTSASKSVAKDALPLTTITPQRKSTRLLKPERPNYRYKLL